MALVLIACLVLAAALAWWIFTAPAPVHTLSDLEVKRQALQERKKSVYDNLRDLHFEHLAGKLSDADYERTRRMLEGEVTGVTAALDQLS
jgi:hypothetical protein